MTARRLRLPRRQYPIPGVVLTPFELQRDFSPTTPTAPGAYQVGALTLQNGAALFSATDAVCQATLANTVRATSGAEVGAQLQPGDSVSLKVNNLNVIWLDAQVNGEGVSYTYTTD